jgi:hypothetical protein
MGAPATRSRLPDTAVYRRSIAGVHRNLTNYQLNSIFRPLFGEDARSDRIPIKFWSRRGQTYINFNISRPRSAGSGSRQGRPAKQERPGFRPRGIHARDHEQAGAWGGASGRPVAGAGGWRSAVGAGEHPATGLSGQQPRRGVGGGVGWRQGRAGRRRGHTGQPEQTSSSEEWPEKKGKKERKKEKD